MDKAQGNTFGLRKGGIAMIAFKPFKKYNLKIGIEFIFNNAVMLGVGWDKKVCAICLGIVAIEFDWSGGEDA